MKLYLNGNDIRYAAEQIAIVLFPDDKPCVVTARPPSGDYAEIAIESSDTHVAATSKIIKNGTQYIATEERTFPSKSDALHIKKYVSEAVKISFYRAAIPLLDAPPKWGAMTGIRPAKVASKLMDAGKTLEEVDSILEKKYFVTKRRRELAIAAALAGERAVLGMQRRDISLYIGIPFCASRCKYCSFVSHSIDKAQHLVTPYLEALSREMQLVGASIKKIGCKVKTLYIGGGTPTALSASQLKEVMRMARDNFDLNGLIEYTVEAGRPDTVDTEKLSIIREYGATRVSVNPQSMDDKVLKLMGRGHTAQDIADMVSDVRKVGGLDINMDVIAGLPGDSYDGFCDTISKVLALSPDNITVHTLAIKKGSALHDLVIEKPSGDTVANMVDYAFEAVSNAGFAPYYLYRQKYMSGNMENVGYTRRGKESVYNILIMEELQTIISLGAGGVTKLVDRDRGAITRIFNHKYPYEYNADTDKFARSCAVIEDFYNAEKE